MFTAAILVSSMSPIKSSISVFELDRRLQLGDEKVVFENNRERYYGNLKSIIDTIRIILIVSLFVVLIATLGWLVGCVVAFFALIIIQMLSGLSVIMSISRNIYESIEHRLIGLLDKYSFLAFVFKSTARPSEPKKLGSRFEIEQIIDQSDGVLSDDEKRLLSSGLHFFHKKIREIMVPRDEIVSIDMNEFLGPLVLDDLHKTGHKRLPVVAGDADHIVGVLNLRGLMSLDNKKSMTAGKAMDVKVYYLRDDQNLDVALAAFIKTHTNIMIVIDKNRQTVGILTLEDLIKTMFGREVSDEFEDYESPHAVARRK